MYHIEELAHGVYARIGGRPLEPNSGILVGDDGVTLFDTAYSPAAGRAILADIARITPKPVRTVIVSHHHFDHSWGNQVFAGTRIIGHAGAHAAMQADPDVQVRGIRTMAPTAGAWFGLTPEEFNAELDELTITPPTEIYTDQLSLHVGGHEVRLYHPGPGHTFGDTLVHLPGARLLFAGDLVCNHLIPVVGDGDPAGFGRVLAGVAAMDLAAIVPGHGALAGKGELGEFAACLDELCAQVSAARAAGAPTPRDAFERVHLDAFAGWHGREMLPNSVRRIYRSLDASESSGQARSAG